MNGQNGHEIPGTKPAHEKNIDNKPPPKGLVDTENDVCSPLLDPAEKELNLENTELNISYPKKNQVRYRFSYDCSTTFNENHKKKIQVV